MIEQKKTLKKSTKNRRNIFLIIAAVIALAAFIFYITSPLFNKSKVDAGEDYMFTKEGELTILDSLNNKKIKLDIEFADNDYDRQLGLMFRTKMDEKQGMLFLFPVEEMQSFWMRNTLISLDIIFVNANKQIVTIHKNTYTQSDQSYPSSKPAMYVLELLAGTADKYNIKEGDKLSWVDLRLNMP